MTTVLIIGASPEAERSAALSRSEKRHEGTHQPRSLVRPHPHRGCDHDRDGCLRRHVRRWFGFALLDLSLHSRLLATSPHDIATLIQPPLGDVFVVGLIALNTALEWLLLPALVLLSWHIPKRRTLVVGAAALYYAMRAWSYLYFVPRIFDWADLPAGQPFSAEQLDQIRVWVALSWVRVRWMA
jgi:hypothetical protein